MPVTSPPTPLLDDIQRIILKYAPRVTLPILARTSESLRKEAAKRLYENLHLPLSAHYGRLPYTILADEDRRTWEFARADEAQRSWEGAYRAKLEQLIGRADAVEESAAWTSVKEITLVAQPSATPLLIQILTSASQVERMGIRAAHITSRIGFSPESQSTLESTLLTDTITFPALKHLILGPRSMFLQVFAYLFISRSPNLQSLIVDLSRYDPCDDDWEDLDLPEKPTTTKLQRVQVSWGKGEFNDDPGSWEVLIGILGSSPDLRQLSIWANRITEEMLADTTGIEAFSAAINRHESVQDLCWNINVPYFESIVEGATISSIRRLLLTLWCRKETVSFLLPAMPNLQHLFVAETPPSPYANFPTLSGLLTMPQSSLHFPMLPDFAASLRLNPSLRTIHILDTMLDQNGLELIDQLDALAPDEMDGQISSMRYGEEEVLCARIKQDFVEMLDEGRLPDGYWPSDASPCVRNVTIIDYTATDGTDRRRHFQFRSDLTVVSYTDYRGRVVPLEITEEMRKVEGGSVDWERRGVEVGGEAWKVLVEWYEGLADEMEGVEGS